MRRFNITILLVAIGISFSVAQIPTDGLVASYPFNGNANDESGSGFNGIVNGASLTTDRFGNANAAYSFDENQDIIIPNSQDQNLYPISISLWYNVATISDNENGNVFSKYSPASWTGYQIIAEDRRNVDNDGVIYNNGYGTSSWYIRNTENRVIGYYGEDPFLQQFISFDTWYHYVFVLDETGGKIYVDGQLIDSHEWTGTAGPCDNTYEWKIGGFFDYWFKGKIDDINIYNRALSEAEIVQLYSDLHNNLEIAMVHEQDSLALVALYNSTDGDNWTNNDNWLNGPVDSWYGVTVENGRVVEIKLTGNDLKGALPSDIGTFSELRRLVMDANPNLEGGIPSEIGNLTNLEDLNLHGAWIGGELPKSIGNLSKLRSIFLWGNGISGEIPEEFGNLVSLEWANIGYNHFSGYLPESIGNLTNIKFLTIGLNSLEGPVPSTLNNLINLTSLGLDGNQFTYLPDLSNLNLTGIYGLVINRNNFEFDDIERVLNIDASKIHYLPQSNFGEVQSIIIDEGSNHQISYTVGGSQNKYQWYKLAYNGGVKDTVEIAGQTTNTLNFSSVQLSDAGTYLLKATSDLVPELELWSNPYTLEVVETTHPEFIMTNTEAFPNEVLSYPVMIKGFENILTAQFTITWDPVVVEYQGIQDFGIVGLDANSFHLVEPGRLTFSWSPEDLQPVSLEDGFTLFNILFKTIGEPGEVTDLVFGDDPTVREVSDGDAQILDAIYTNGRISIMDEVILGGYIKTQKKEPVAGIEVELIGAMELTTTTDETGWYEFSVFPNQEYHIAPLFDTKDDDGVTTLDIVVMHWHILGKKYMMSNLDLIASDVNGSGSLTTLDLAETRSVVLHNDGEKFRGKNSVEFINDEYTGDGDVFEYKNYLDIIPTVSYTNLDFTAVKRGDASRSWNPNKNTGGRENLLDQIEIQLERISSSGNIEKIALKVGDFKELVGLQFTLDWDPKIYKFVKLNDGQLHFEANESLTNIGQLTVAWNTDGFAGKSLTKEDVISIIEFEVLGMEDPDLHITSDLTPALAYNSDLESFRVIDTTLKDQLDNINLRIYPNPAQDMLFINSSGGIISKYSIITTTGSTVKTGTLDNLHQIDIQELGKGVYVLQLTDSNAVRTIHKFIKE